MLIITGEQITKRSVPPCSPKPAVVVDLAELGALVRGGGEDVEDALLIHDAGAQADALARVLLAQASERINCRMEIVAQDYTEAVNQN